MRSTLSRAQTELRLPAQVLGPAQRDPVPAVLWSGRLGRFVLTRSGDVAAVLHDTGTFSSAVVPQVPPRDRDALAGFTDRPARWLFFLDPPEHTARRAPLTRALSARAVAALAARVDTVARALVAGLPAAGFDVVADVAHPLAAQVIADGLSSLPGGRFLGLMAYPRPKGWRGHEHARKPQALVGPAPSRSPALERDG
ncbi:hypothetical protein AB0K00_52240 [Dactylosporangium sp. NPDC049525]|uniref:hypothetical protein n=1 Tax=Dactylosporangium sp. NPDC049525 TaxID=3154730 RepID=UPI003442B75E